jgi:putative ABC transport system substrate-binding protein
MRHSLFILLLVALLLASCGGQATPAPVESVAPTPAPVDAGAQEAPQLVEWFIPPAGVLANWDVRLDPQNAGIVLIEPKSGATQGARLFFLLTKGTPVFDRGIELVLTTFMERGFNTISAVMLAPDVESGEAALAYAEANSYELIYPVGSDATKFVYENYLGGKLPVVTLLSKDPVLLGQVADYFIGSGNNIAFTSVSVPVEVQMTYFRQLVPDLKYIAVIYDSNNSSAVKTQVEPLDAYGLANGSPSSTWPPPLKTTPKQCAWSCKTSSLR